MESKLSGNWISGLVSRIFHFLDIAFSLSRFLILVLILPEPVVQDKAMAIYCIRGIICVPCRGSGLAGTRCTYGQGSFFMDWRCWHPSVCFCVDQVLLDLFFFWLFQIWSLTQACRYLQRAHVLDCSFWRVSWHLCCLKMAIFMVKTALYTSVCHGGKIVFNCLFSSFIYPLDIVLRGSCIWCGRDALICLTMGTFNV